MDLIERLFGLAPDGGSGTMEAILLAVPLLMLALLASDRIVARRRP
jgi:hypothetical protein